MALKGPLKIKNVIVPEAFIQINQFNVTVGMAVNGIAHIYASVEQARNFENFIEMINVHAIDDMVTDYRQQLYWELQQNVDFAHLEIVPDIFNLNDNRSQRTFLGLPAGRYSPETGHEYLDDQ